MVEYVYGLVLGSTLFVYVNIKLFNLTLFTSLSCVNCKWLIGQLHLVIGMGETKLIIPPCISLYTLYCEEEKRKQKRELRPNVSRQELVLKYLMAYIVRGE